MEICDKLCTFILDPKKDDIRDVYSIGLKTLVMDVPESSGQEVAQRLMWRLLTGVSGDFYSELCYVFFLWHVIFEFNKNKNN